jgi:pimeloyl-ACP methyl ester carboxylesterase
MKSLTLSTPIGEFSALRNDSPESAQKILAIHGWLDNRASFIPMLPFMDASDFVAVDLPGHGYSAHRSGNQFGYLADFVQTIPMILDALGWQQCHLVGHSMGGGVACIYTACSPKRIQTLSLIDLLGPLSSEAKEAPIKMAKALKDYSAWDPTRKRYFDDLDAAVKARMLGSAFPLDYNNSKLIMEYTQTSPKGLQLMSDPRLKFASPFSFTEDQVLAFIKNIQQPVLLAYASEGILNQLKSTSKRLTSYADLTRLDLKGGHYVHMEQPKSVAKAVLELATRVQG